MESKKITSYLLYAIGEVFLVVIGIMIAVSINNINDQKQESALERKLLQELVSDLKVDELDILENIAIHLQSENSCLLLRKHLLNDLQMHDTLMQHFTHTYNFTSFLYKDGAYETMLSKGLTIIKNDNIRQLTTNYYEERIPFQLNIQQATIQQMILISEDHLALFKNFNWVYPMDPWDFEALKKDRSYLSWLSYTAVNRKFERSRFESLLRVNRELQKVINEELITD